MLDTLKTLIVDFQELHLETGVPRRVNVVPVAGKATICIGVRRSGKSTYLYQRIQDLLDRGVSRENILYLNFFDDRLHGLLHESPGVILEAYYSLYPEKKNAEAIYCFFDEIQVLPGWEAFVDRLMRTEKCEVWITGSSAHMLSREIATQMRGRALSWEMFPFSFPEYLDCRSVNIPEKLGTKQRLLLQKAFEGYWESGGFPESAMLDARMRVKIHQEYFNSVLYRDLVERHDIPHPRAVAELARWLVDNTASLYTVNRLLAYLRTLGHNLSKPSVSDYLEWFEDAYFLFTVRLFDASLARANANPKKIYCIDHALVASVSSGILINSGHLLENLVFVALRRTMTEISYYKTRGGREVDFIVHQRGQARRLVQVCESLAHPGTREREIGALAEAMAEQGLDRAVIVTRNDAELVNTAEGTIEVVPAWRFLLSLPDAGG